MAERWFRVPTIGDGSDNNVKRPKYSDRVPDSSGHQIGNSPQYVVHYRGDTTTLDGIAAESDATELTDQKALDLYNGASVPGLNGTGRPWTVSELNNEKFPV